MFKLSILTEILIFGYSFQQFIYILIIRFSFPTMFGAARQRTFLKIQYTISPNVYRISFKIVSVRGFLTHFLFL